MEKKAVKPGRGVYLRKVSLTGLHVCNLRERENSRNTHSAARSCFTLIELLMVIAMTAILAGLLFPALGNARSAGRRIFCTENARSIGFAFASYQHDFYEYFPIYLGSSQWNILLARLPSTSIWKKFGLGYVTPNTFRCPEVMSAPAGELITHYGYNYQYLAFGPGRHRRITECRFPAQQLVVTDAGGYIIFPYYTDTGFKPVPRHDLKKTLNLLMADGHVENFRILFYDNPWGQDTGYQYPHGVLGLGGSPSYIGETPWCKFRIL